MRELKEPQRRDDNLDQAIYKFKNCMWSVITSNGNDVFWSCGLRNIPQAKQAVGLRYCEKCGNFQDTNIDLPNADLGTNIFF